MTVNTNEVANPVIEEITEASNSIREYVTHQPTPDDLSRGTMQGMLALGNSISLATGFYTTQAEKLAAIRGIVTSVLVRNEMNGLTDFDTQYQTGFRKGELMYAQEIETKLNAL